jgi:hypothetical protein
MWSHTAALCLCVLLGIAVTIGGRKIDFPGCRYQRQDAIDCGRIYVDLNHDGFITIDEIRVARTWLPWYTKPFAWFSESPAQSMANCGATPDGRITPEDFMRFRTTCMESCFKVESAVEYICNNAAAAVGDPPWPVHLDDSAGST